MFCILVQVQVRTFTGKSFYEISVARREVAPTENSWVSTLNCGRFHTSVCILC